MKKLTGMKVNPFKTREGELKKDRIKEGRKEGKGGEEEKEGYKGKREGERREEVRKEGIEVGRQGGREEKGVRLK